MRHASLTKRLDGAVRLIRERRDEAAAGRVGDVLEHTRRMYELASSLPASVAGLAQAATDVTRTPEQLEYLAESLQLASLVSSVIADTPAVPPGAGSKDELVLRLLDQHVPIETITVVIHPIITSLMQGDPAILLRRRPMAVSADHADATGVELPSVALSPASESGDPLLDDASLRAVAHRSIRDVVERTLSNGAFSLGRHVALLETEARVVGDDLELHLAVSLATRIGSKVSKPTEDFLIWVWAVEVPELWTLSDEDAQEHREQWPDRPIQTAALNIELLEVGDRFIAARQLQERVLGQPFENVHLGPY